MRFHSLICTNSRPLFRAFLPFLVVLASSPKLSASIPPETFITQKSPRELESLFGNPAIMRTVFDTIRMHLYGEASPADSGRLSDLPNQPVFLCAYGQNFPNICVSGSGKTFAGSLKAAALALKRTAGFDAGRNAKQRTRLKVDIEMSSVTRIFNSDLLRMPFAEVALSGYRVSARGKTSFVLPSELLEQEIYSSKGDRPGVSRARLTRAFLDRNPKVAPLSGTFRYDEFRTVSWIERQPAGDQRPDIFRTYRIQAYDSPELDKDNLKVRAIAAANYLARHTDPTGKIRYHYNVPRDAENGKYNMLRHAGSTYALLQAYRAFRQEHHLAAALRAISFFLSSAQRKPVSGPSGEVSALFIIDNDKIKLGGSGIGLLMLSEYAKATGDQNTFLEPARALAYSLISMQKKTGEFYSFADPETGDLMNDRVSDYYPGEAILGLMSLHAWDPNPLWRNSAVSGAKWLITVRDRAKSISELDNDHWLMMALEQIFRVDPQSVFLEHSLKLARAVEFQARGNLKLSKIFPDYLGSYYDPPRSTPAAIRTEGLLAVVKTCKLGGEQCSWMNSVIKNTIRFQLRFQYTDDLMWWIKNKDDISGGWMGGIVDPSIRNDFVQHNLSSLLMNTQQ